MILALIISIIVAQGIVARYAFAKDIYHDAP